MACLFVNNTFMTIRKLFFFQYLHDAGEGNVGRPGIIISRSQQKDVTFDVFYFYTAGIGAVGKAFIIIEAVHGFGTVTGVVFPGTQRFPYMGQGFRRFVGHIFSMEGEIRFVLAEKHVFAAFHHEIKTGNGNHAGNIGQIGSAKQDVGSTQRKPRHADFCNRHRAFVFQEIHCFFCIINGNADGMRGQGLP